MATTTINITAPQTSTVNTASVTGAYVIDWEKDTHVLTMTGNSTFTFSNLPINTDAIKRTITIHLTGAFTFTFPSGTDVLGIADYDGSVVNTIVLECVDNAAPTIYGQLTPRA